MPTLAVVFAPKGKMEIREQSLPPGSSFAIIGVDELPTDRVKLVQLAEKLAIQLLEALRNG